MLNMSAMTCRNPKISILQGEIRLDYRKCQSDPRMDVKDEPWKLTLCFDGTYLVNAHHVQAFGRKSSRS